MVTINKRKFYLPSTSLCLVVGISVHNPGINVAKCKSLPRIGNDGLSNQRGIGKGWLAAILEFNSGGQGIGPRRRGLTPFCIHLVCVF